MKKILILSIVLIATSFAFSQNLAKMNDSKRKEYLKKVSKETVFKYGPGYYREYGEPVIERFFVGDKVSGGESFSAEFEEKNNGRFFYRVKYPYDETKEFFVTGFAFQVFIWEDIGNPFDITFGIGRYIDIEELPSTRSGEYPVMEYKRCPPLKMVRKETVAYDAEGNKKIIVKQVPEFKD
ncbi:hypothetical protein [Bacteroides sp. 224]|uniref:hypothetical protein n=1 Tax=Bacteroides sp. 224 TaxID=2302936 RepID=UPI0013D052B9|nr:hypothetical protein [Bacteroides sp. 224]NDV64577.1 hypothetical protein [Bacteroides sp. 224]